MHVFKSGEVRQVHVKIELSGLMFDSSCYYINVHRVTHIRGPRNVYNP